RLPMLGLEREAQVRPLRVGQADRAALALLPDRRPGLGVDQVPKRPWVPGGGEGDTVEPGRALVADVVLQLRQWATLALHQQAVALVLGELLDPLEALAPQVEGALRLDPGDVVDQAAELVDVLHGAV